MNFEARGCKMSNSQRAKARRLRRKHLTKHQRDIMTRQHFGDKEGLKKPPRAERDKILAEKLGL